MSKNTLSNLEQANIRSRSRSLNTLRFASAVKEGEAAVINGLSFIAKLSPNYVPAVGAKVIDLTAAASTAAGTGTLTSDNTELTDGDTVTISKGGVSIVYRFKDTPAQAYDVKRNGTTADTTLGNLVKAINASGIAGTDYFPGTLINPFVSAGAVTAHATTLTSKGKGTVDAASIGTVEASTHLSFGAATLAGGTDASASDASTAFTAAVNAGGLGFSMKATRMSAAEVLLENLNNGDAWTATVTFSGANNVFANPTFYGGGSPAEFPVLRAVKRAAIAQEVTFGEMHFLFAFLPVAAIVVIRTAAGVLKAHDGAVTIAGSRITVDNTGATDFAATDVVTVLASE